VAGAKTRFSEGSTLRHRAGGIDLRRRVTGGKAARRLGLAAGTAVLAAALWWRTHPSACPYAQRFWVETPHPFITRARLQEALAPSPGERVLEVGPGTGYYTLDVAGWIAPDGRLDIFDLQQEMLDHTLRRAHARDLRNITATQGDARALPYPDRSFDAAYLVAVLGEIPDQDAALRELARVLRPGGRLVVGELFGDPHWVAPGALRRRGEAAGLHFDRRLGRLLGHYSVFRR
jgi:SAM-dependent methyltransferase